MGIVYAVFVQDPEELYRWGSREFSEPQIGNWILVLRIAGPIAVVASVASALELIQALRKGSFATGSRAHVLVEGRSLKALVVEERRHETRCRFANGDESWVPNERINFR
jgi:hypothetical protein